MPVHLIDGEPIAARVGRLADAFDDTDLIRLSIERDGVTVELRRRGGQPAPVAEAAAAPAPQPRHVDTLRSDVVGIFRLGRPAPSLGETLAGDRELGFVEALGIRNPVRSLGGGSIVAILAQDGAAVEYGQELFEIDRG